MSKKRLIPSAAEALASAHLFFAQAARKTDPHLRLLFLTCAAFAILGYHPGAEDDTTYLSAVKHQLNPALYPHDLPFVTVQLDFSMFDRAVAALVRLTHLLLGIAVLLLQFAGLYTLLLALWRIAGLCFAEASARWAGTVFVAVMLAVPVAQTHLILADQHLHPRLLATVCILFAVEAVLRRRLVLAVPLLCAGALLHPLMTAYGVSFCAILALVQTNARAAVFALPWLFEPPTPAWTRAIAPRSFLYLYRWPWYAWIAVLGPLAVLAGLRQRAKSAHERTLCSALLLYSGLHLTAALVLLRPGASPWWVQVEPMRFCHLVYLLTALLGAGAFGRWWLRDRPWRWVLVFSPLAAGMYTDQQLEFAGSPHIEWPGEAPNNPWLQAFAWVRANTPTDAYFALNPRYAEEPLEGVHSFRALGERSMLADAVKDVGPVTHVPHLALRWLRETGAAAGWTGFSSSDFQALHAQFGVDWIVVEHPVPGLPCPYNNRVVWVCRLAGR